MYKCIMSILVIGLCFACKTTEIVDTQEEQTQIFTYAKSPCFGKCPTYSISLLNDGTLHYNGQAHAKKLGIYTTKLSTEEMKYIKNEIKNIDMLALSKLPPENVADGSKTSYVDHLSNPELGVSWMGGIPGDLVALVNWLEKINRTATWTKLSNPNTGGYETSEVSNQLIVEFHDGIKAEEWIKAYSRVGAKLKKEIDASSNRWIIEFDETLVGPYKFLRNVQGDPAIKLANPNRKVENRSNSH